MTAGCSKNSDQEITPDPTPVPLPHDYTRLTGVLPAQPESAWRKGDTINVFSLASVLDNCYVQSGATDAMTGNFKLTTGTEDIVETEKQLYAYTPNRYIYSKSATTDGLAKLTHTIPAAYSASEVGASGGIVPRSVSYWGFAAFGSDGSLYTELHGLTSLLKISPSALPVDTKALVLVTHPQFTLNNQKQQGGKGESLSGTLAAVLQAGTSLKTDRHFTSTDTLRINLDATSYDCLYIPVIAGTYSSLSVIAVSSDDVSDYSWQGSIVKHFENKTFYVEEVY